MDEEKKGKRGFALLSPEVRKDISSMGGRAAHASGSAYTFSPEEARIAGSKGGKATHAKRQAAKQEK
jgi:uncharacterized protein